MSERTERLGNGFNTSSMTEALTLDIEIDPPIEDGGKTYTSLHLEEPTHAMIERAEMELANGINHLTLRKHQRALVSQCAKVPPGVVAKMRISQVREAADFLAQFENAGRVITGTSSLI